MTTSRSALVRPLQITMLRGMALALTGVRRGGKTHSAVLLSRDIAESVFYFNFEDPVVLDARSPDIIDALLELHEESAPAPTRRIILDEIQRVPHWERWVRKAVDLGKHEIIITGSSSHLLSSELATAVAGRVIEHVIWPLSFTEYLSFTGEHPRGDAPTRRLAREYLKWGGFPKAALLGDALERVLLLKQYLQDIVIRDVTYRHDVRDSRALDQLVAWYLTNVSCLHSYQAVRKAFGGSTQTIAAQTAHLEGPSARSQEGLHHRQRPAHGVTRFRA